MGIWDTYESRFGDSTKSQDNPKRNSRQDHARARMLRKVTDSLSYKTVKLGDQELQVAIRDVAEDYTIKRIFAMPGETLPHGSLIEWENSMWLITEADAHHELTMEGLMRRCNYYLRWVDDVGNVISRWCVVEDGTKYLVGERREAMMTIGDARIAVTIGKDLDTNKLSRGKRFLIDDPDSEEVLAYELTKTNKLYNVYNGRGVFRFILSESNLTDDDNVELRIADYYSWKPKVNRAVPDTQTGATFERVVMDAKEKRENLPDDIAERKVWL